MANFNIPVPTPPTLSPGYNYAEGSAEEATAAAALTVLAANLSRIQVEPAFYSSSATIAAAQRDALIISGICPDYRTAPLSPLRLGCGSWPARVFHTGG